MVRLVLSLLGGFQAALDDHPLTSFESNKVRALLAYLAVEADRPHRRESLAALLWPDFSETTALTNLRVALADLRSQIHDRHTDPPLLLIDRDTIQFNQDASAWVDVWAFSEEGTGDRGQGLAVSEPRAATGEQRSVNSEKGSIPNNPQSLIYNQQSSIALYRGPFLAGFSIPDSVPYEEWLILERERLHQQALRILRQLADFYESCGEYEQALIYSRRQVELEPWLDEAHRQIMRLLALNGQSSQALAQYDICKRTLADELGIEPASETTRLYETIRTGRLEDIRPGELLPYPGKSPYKGLQFFAEPDAALFFGREALTARLLEHIHDMADDDAGASRHENPVGASRPDSRKSMGDCEGSPLLAVVGASGSGKSSLVRAGLVPALKQDGWPVEVITPAVHPMEIIGGIEKKIEDKGSGEKGSGDKERGRILVIDQFEELFTLCRSEEERGEFLDWLLKQPHPNPPQQKIAVGEGELPLPQLSSSDGGGWEGVILVLRADFYGHCARYPLLRQALCARQEYIGPMTVTELRRAIEQPALLNGWELESGLVDLILRDVGASEGHPPEPGALPLLEHALLETWQRRRGRKLALKGYAEAGGVHGAIAKTAESVFARLAPAQQALARRIFLRLTELGEGTQDTRRRAPIGELTPSANDAVMVESLLRTLAEARLITLAEGTAEVAHEALIREWPALRLWLSEDREGLHLHHRLTGAAQAWAEQGRDAGELYRGARLAQASEWAESHAQELNALEHEYLQASQAQAEREAGERDAQRQRELEAAQHLARTQRQRSLVLSVGLLIAITLGLLALVFYRQSNAHLNTARAEANVALGRQALAQALVLSRDSDTNIIQSGLLVAESLQRAPGKGASDVAQQVAGALLYPVSSTQHEYLVNAVAFSSDGRRVVSGSADGMVRVWEADTGVEVTHMAHEKAVNAVAFSPDGKWVVSGSADGTARVWWAKNGIEVARTTHEGAVTAVTFSPDGRSVVSGSYDKTARVWAAESGVEIARKEHEGAVYAVAFSPNTGYSVASGSYDGTVLVWVAATGEEEFRMQHEKPVTALAFSPDGRLVATGSADNTARVFRLTNEMEEIASVMHGGSVTCVAFSPDGKWVVSGSIDGTARVWEADGGAEAARFTHEGAVYEVDFSPDGRWVVSGSGDHTAQVWEASSGAPVARLAHQGLVGAVTFDPSGNRIATGSYDQVARVWRLSSGIEVARMTHTYAIAAMAVSPDGRWVASGSMDGRAQIWEAATGQAAARYTPGRFQMDVAISPDSRWLAMTGYYSAQVLDLARKTDIIRMSLELDGRVVAFSPDGRWVVAGTWGNSIMAPDGYDGVLEVWDLAEKKRVATMRHEDTMLAVAFSPDGNRVASSSLDGTMRVWETATGKEVARVEDNSVVNAVAFSPDGRWVVFGSGTGAAIVWDPVMKEEVARMKHARGVNDVTFSPDGRWVASGSQDGTARVWVAATGKEVARMEHESTVNDVAFSPDGRWVASGSMDGTARVWEAATGREMTRMVHGGAVNEVAFGSDGHWVVSGSDDYTVRVWIWQPEDIIALLCARLPRNFTQEEWQQFFGDVEYHQTCENLPVEK